MLGLEVQLPRDRKTIECDKASRTFCQVKKRLSKSPGIGACRACEEVSTSPQTMIPGTARSSRFTLHPSRSSDNSRNMKPPLELDEVNRRFQSNKDRNQIGQK